MQSYARAVGRLYELQKFGIKLGLSSTANLLRRLGNPHLGLKCAHIAGSNGKGSLAAMLETTLLAAGIKVGLYTSPHLVSFCERFRINGRDISQGRVVKLAAQVWRAVDHREPPTFFEFVTAMAFLHFAQQGVQWSLMETGLGGRLDATNVCQPSACVISNISLEHQEYLGSTLAQIAWEKAGIIKPGVPLVHGVAPGPARRVVEKRARSLGAPIIRRGRDLRFRWGPDGLSLWGRLMSLKGAALGLPGWHQGSNAALALGAAEVLVQAGADIGVEHLRQGLAQARWPGRLERWPTKPGQPTLWLDGAHNPAAARALLANLDLVRRQGGPLVMVLGIMADKDVARLLAMLTPAADRLIFSRPRYQRAAQPELLASLAPSGGPPGEVVGELGRAIKRAQRLAGPRGAVLVTGSLFTVGEARALLLGAPTSDLP